MRVGQQHTTKVETKRREMETSILQEGSQEVMRRRLAINGRDQHAAALVLCINSSNFKVEFSIDLVIVPL